MALPAVLGAIWNDQLKFWDIGRVEIDKNPGKHQRKPVKTMYACGSIPEGGYVYGSFEDEGVDALCAGYRCDRGRLRLRHSSGRISVTLSLVDDANIRDLCPTGALF